MVVCQGGKTALNLSLNSASYVKGTGKCSRPSSAIGGARALWDEMGWDDPSSLCEGQNDTCRCDTSKPRHLPHDPSLVSPIPVCSSMPSRFSIRIEGVSRTRDVSGRA